MILLPLLNQTTRVKASENHISQLSPSLSSKKLVSAVLSANPKLEIAQAAWEASIARIDQRASFEDPMFSYTMAPQTIDNSHTEYGQKIEISQKLPWPGKRHLRNEAASHKASAAAQTINSLRIKLSAIAKSFYADWYYIHQTIKINQLNQGLLKEFMEIATSRYSLGIANKQDALRAEMEFAMLEHQSITLTRKKKSIRTHINTLLNKQPDSPLPPPLSLSVIESIPTVEYLHKHALQVHPKLKAFTASIQAAKSQSKLTQKNNYPDITVKAGYNSLWKDSSKHFTVGVGINLPLFQDKHRAAENEALAQIKQTIWQQTDYIAKLKEEIQIYYDLTNESIHVFSLYKSKLLPLSKETLDAAESDYQSGKGDFLSLISSEKKYMQTQLQTEQALADIHRRLAKLESAAGYIKPFPSSPAKTSETQ
ncbi:MAG: TolC family protein [Methylococcales bacterium]|nr:TolC family protein [Methylococcales bacterium]